jgi:hypothetical protein
MSGIRAKVKEGRLLVDEPTSLPEGTVLELVLDDEGDDLTENEREALNAALANAWQSAKTGNVRPARAIIGEIRSRSK